MEGKVLLVLGKFTDFYRGVKWNHSLGDYSRKEKKMGKKKKIGSYILNGRFQDGRGDSASFAEKRGRKNSGEGNALVLEKSLTDNCSVQAVGTKRIVWWQGGSGQIDKPKKKVKTSGFRSYPASPDTCSTRSYLTSMAVP